VISQYHYTLFGRIIFVKLPRRKFLHLAAAAAAAPAFPRLASALDYPTRPVHIIVGFPPGGGTDIAARLMGQWLSENLRQSFVVENRPGASTNIATVDVVRAPADGYTLLLISSVQAINATLFERLNYNLAHDIAPVASFSREPDVMVVNPSVPAKTVPEFITYAQTIPGKINMASSGIGTSVHLSGELFKMMTGVNLVHVPYRGAGLAVTDLLGGQVQVMFATMPSSIEYIRSGKLRALGVTTAARSEALPSIPTIGEFVSDYEASAFYGVGAPKDTPLEIIDKLNREINVILARPAAKARLADLGGTVVTGSPADFGKLIAEETEKWGKVIRTAGIKAE
jgi:tripartite-type tricarboxylate transporter receptor subunit TctC